MSTFINNNSLIDSVRMVRRQQHVDLLDNLFHIEKDSSIYFTKNNLDVQQVVSEDSTVQTGYEGIRRPFTLEGDDGIFALLLICFVLFTRIYREGMRFLKENVYMLFSPRGFINSYGETTSTDFWFNAFLVFQTVLLSAIIIFDVFVEQDVATPSVPRNSFFIILIFTLIIALFLGAKSLMYMFLSYLFSLDRLLDVWRQVYMIVLQFLGIIIFIPTLMLVYSQLFHEYLLLFLGIVFILSRIILFYRIITFF